MRGRFARNCLLGAALAVLLLVQGSPSVGAVAFTFNWLGTPSAPTPWNPTTGFDLVVHDRDLTRTWGQPYPFQAQHGADCAPFLGFGIGGTHLVQQYQDEVFICNNHMMTGINGQGYGEISFTPSVLLDWSQGTAVATWKVSTLRTSCRDWLSFNLMPFLDNLPLTEGFDVDLAGEPRNEVYFTNSASCRTTYHGYDVRNFNQHELSGSDTAVEDVVSPSASVRTRFELDVSRFHVRFGLPDFNRWMFDSDLQTPLPYTQAVLQFEQHSYTPTKECTATPTFCEANTWHWSDLSMSSVVPFTILRGDRFQVSQDGNTVRFPAPAPANSFVRLEALALPGSLKASPDHGKTWIPITKAQPSTKNAGGLFTDQHMNNVFVPVPAGTRELMFSGANTYWIPWVVRNPSIWSTEGSPLPGQGGPPQLPPSPTAKPSASPIGITGAPCIVTVNGQDLRGSCTGTFKPGG